MNHESDVKHGPNNIIIHHGFMDYLQNVGSQSLTRITLIYMSATLCHAMT